MSLKLSDLSFLCKNSVEGEIVGSRPVMFNLNETSFPCKNDGEGVTQDKGEETKLDLEFLLYIQYSFNFEEIGLGFGGEQSRK